MLDQSSTCSSPIVFVLECDRRQNLRVKNDVGDFERILDGVIDYNVLRKMSWHGIPAQCRSKVWKVLLGYTPAVVHKAEDVICQKRSEYWSLVNRYLGEDVRRDDDIYHQVSIDVPRTCPDELLFRQPKVRESMLRILYCSAIRRPASGYVQGMNDLVAPFLDSFLRDFSETDGSVHISKSDFEDLEADVFWCLGKLIDNIQNNFTFNQAGLHRQISALRDIVRRADGTNNDLTGMYVVDLLNHLTNIGVDFTQFSFRWFNCFLLREFPLSYAQRIWDTYIADGDLGFNEFHIYVCAALLCRLGPDLLKLDFQDAFVLLQNPPTRQWEYRDIDSLLSEAYILKSIFYETINRKK